MKYAGGVVIAADTLASYGSLARFTNVQRLHKLNDMTLMGAGGEMSDFQHLQKVLDSEIILDEAQGDGHCHSPAALHSLITRVMYNRRNKFDPLWNAIVVAGFKDGKSFLGFTDLVGSAFQDDYVATGMGGHIALPILRKSYREDISYDEARAVIEECMKVLFYRDCRTINRVCLRSALISSTSD